MRWFPVMKFAAPADGTTTIRDYPLVPLGSWYHPEYGLVEITAERVARMVQNFGKRLFQTTEGAVVDRDHDPKSGSHAFIKAVRQGEDGGLLADLELSPAGVQLFAAGTHRFLSPNIRPVYQEPTTGETHIDVLTGASFVPHTFFEQAPQATPTPGFSAPEGLTMVFSAVLDPVPQPGDDTAATRNQTASPEPSNPLPATPGSGGAADPTPGPSPAGAGEGSGEQNFAALEAEVAELRFSARQTQFDQQFSAVRVSGPDGNVRLLTPAYRGESSRLCAEVASHDPALATRVAKQLAAGPEALYLPDELGFSMPGPATPKVTEEDRLVAAQLGVKIEE